MTVHLLGFLTGLFGVPLVLLKWAHGIRRRGPRARRVFWGAVTGHLISGLLAVTLAMIPPEAWTSEDTARGFLGLWGLFVFPVCGALVAWLPRDPGTDVRRDPRDPPG